MVVLARRDVSVSAGQPWARAKLPDISIHKAATGANIENVKQHIASGADVNATDEERVTAG